MHPVFFQLGNGLPVCLTRRRLHQQEWLILQSAHQIMIHTGVAGERDFISITVPQWVAVPRDDIDRLRELPVVVIIKILHEVGSRRQLRVDRFERRDFMLTEIGHAIGAKAFPI